MKGALSIAEGLAEMDVIAHRRGPNSGDLDDFKIRRCLFEQVQVPGRIVMIVGSAPLALMVQTTTGYLVRVELDQPSSRALALKLLEISNG